VFISIILVPFLLAKIGIWLAGIISPVVPIMMNTSEVSAAAILALYASCGIPSPKKIKLGFNNELHLSSWQEGGLLLILMYSFK